MEKIKSFVREHPWETAGIVFVIGVILIYLFWPRGSGSTASSGSGLDSYYNAQAAAVQAGAGVYGQQIQANAATTAANDNLQAILAQIAAGQNVQNTTTDAQLKAIQDQTSAALGIATTQTKGQTDLATIFAKNQVDVGNIAAGVYNNQIDAALQAANIGAGVANNSTAAALQYGLAQVNETGHAVDVAGQTVQQQQQLAYQLGHETNIANEAVQLGNIQTNQATANYNYLLGTQGISANYSLGAMNNNLQQAQAAYNYQLGSQAIATGAQTQTTLAQNYYSALLASQAAAWSQAAGGAEVGIFAPGIGNPVANAGGNFGGPVNPATIAQIQQYPWLDPNAKVA